MALALNNSLERFTEIIREAFKEAVSGYKPEGIIETDFDTHGDLDPKYCSYTLDALDLPVDYFKNRPSLIDLDNDLQPNTKLTFTYKSDNFIGLRPKEIYYHRLNIKEYLKRKYFTWANFSSATNATFPINDPKGSLDNDGLEIAISKVLSANDNSRFVRARIVSNKGEPVIIEVKSPVSGQDTVAERYFVPDQVFYMHVQHEEETPWIRDTM